MAGPLDPLFLCVFLYSPCKSYIGSMKSLCKWLLAAAVAALFFACGDDSSNGPDESSVSSSSEVGFESGDTLKSSEAQTPKSSAAAMPESSEGVLASSSAESSTEPPESGASTAGASSESASSASLEGDAVPESSAMAPQSESSTPSSDSTQKADDGVCSDCDSFTAADPTLTENGGYGSVTTYGSVTEKETSLGGACNYGQTNIRYYAAIHVNVSPGDNLGPWQGGSACGGCVHVKARTPDGWKEVTVRITDRCPDANCGVDLGGAPASDIMGDRVGRYSGEWEFVSCEGVEGVWGDSTSIWVKEGASKFWSIVQVRNPKDAVKSMTLKGVQSNDMHVLEMVVGTENFWTVPPEVLGSDNEYTMTVQYRSGEPDTWLLKGSDLAVEEANLYLYEHRAD